MEGLPERGVLRIIDANANRVREGLRVVEEYVRFVCDDAALTASIKDARHRVSQLLSPPAVADALVRSRDAGGDVGAGPSPEAEQRRADTAAVVRANLKRVQEGLRALEEYGKLLDPAIGEGFKRLRFEVYTIEERVVERLG